MIVLGPHAVRYGSAFFGVAVAWVGIIVAVAAREDQPLPYLAPAFLILGVGSGGWFTCRALRLGVEALPDRFLVRGLFWSRQIPYSAISSMPMPQDVTALPSIEWFKRGRRRYLLLTAFWVSPGPFAVAARRSAEESVMRLDRYRKDRIRGG